MPVDRAVLASVAPGDETPFEQQPTLVVLRALGIGDLLTAVPALRGLADAFPRHRRLLAAPVALAPLVRLIDRGALDHGRARGKAPAGVPDLREPVVHGLVDTLELGPLPADAHGAAIAVNLHGRGPQSHRRLLETGPEELVAFHHPDVPESAGGPPWIEQEHEVARWCRLLSESGIDADRSRLEIAPPTGMPPVPCGATVIHPGAASAARRWPGERWAEVARHELTGGRSVLLTGGPKEVGLAQAVAEAAGLPREAVLAGRTDLAELARVVASAACVASGDTGIAHLATALRKPSVLLFGPTRPSEWGPPPGRSWQRVLWSGTTGDPHGRRTDPGLLAIDPGAVIRALDEVRASRSRLTAVASA